MLSEVVIQVEELSKSGRLSIDDHDGSLYEIAGLLGLPWNLQMLI